MFMRGEYKTVIKTAGNASEGTKINVSCEALKLNPVASFRDFALR